MEIQVGEYIRTKYGIITKIVNIDEHCRHFGERLEDTIYIVDNEKLKYRLNAEDIKKHSFNIIDLIEVGDIVDGFKVFGIFEREGHEKVVCDTPDDDFYGNFATNKDIFSVVTKEQFQAMEYEVK